MNSEDDKNPEIVPAINSDGSQKTLVNKSDIPTQTEHAKFKVKKILLRALVFVLVVPLALIIIMIILLFSQGSIKMNKLNNHAKVLEKELDSLVFIEGQSINAKGVVDGDALTASDNPAQSTYARGSLEVNKSLAELETEVSTNLSKSGFTREGGSETPYYATSMNGGTYDSIVFRYIRGDEAMRIMYKFDKAYTCPKDYVCKHSPKSLPNDNIYPVNGFGTLVVNKMNISFSDKSSDYHSGYLYY